MNEKDNKIRGIKKDNHTTKSLLHSLYSMLAPEQEEEEEPKSKNRYNVSTGTLYVNQDECEEEEN